MTAVEVAYYGQAGHLSVWPLCAAARMKEVVTIICAYWLDLQHGLSNHLHLGDASGLADWHSQEVWVKICSQSIHKASKDEPYVIHT